MRVEINETGGKLPMDATPVKRRSKRYRREDASPEDAAPVERRSKQHRRKKATSEDAAPVKRRSKRYRRKNATSEDAARLRVDINETGGSKRLPWTPLQLDVKSIMRIAPSPGSASGRLPGYPLGGMQHHDCNLYVSEYYVQCVPRRSAQRRHIRAPSLAEQ